MDRRFYTQKIRKLSDDKLKELLQLRTAENMELIAIAQNEAARRGIDPKTIEVNEEKVKSIKAAKKEVNYIFKCFQSLL